MTFSFFLGVMIYAIEPIVKRLLGINKDLIVLNVGDFWSFGYKGYRAFFGRWGVSRV